MISLWNSIASTTPGSNIRTAFPLYGPYPCRQVDRDSASHPCGSSGSGLSNSSWRPCHRGHQFRAQDVSNALPGIGAGSVHTCHMPGRL